MNSDGSGRDEGCPCGCGGESGSCAHDGRLHAAGGEEPAVFSFRRRLDTSGERSAGEVVERQRRAIEELCARAEEEGAVVGHVKMMIVADNGMAWLSNTGDGTVVSTSSDWRDTSKSTCELSLAAILFNITPLRLRQLARRAFGE